MNKKFTLLFIFTLFSALLISCREVTADPSPPVVFQPTPATSEKLMAGAAPVVQVVIVGNPAAGEEWFLTQGCNACHSTGAEKLVGPGQKGVYARSGARSGYGSADEYIEASIRYPGEYLVEGYSNLMPASWEEAEKQDIADVIAYLKTLE